MRRSPALPLLVGSTLLTFGLGAVEATAGRDGWGTRWLEASIGGVTVPPGVRPTIVVDQEAATPPVATMVLEGPKGRGFAGGIRPGDDAQVAIRPGPPAERLFTGEVVTIEPFFAGGETRVVIRAFNRLHRLAGERKSRTFVGLTDAEIVVAVAAEHGLGAEPSGDLSRRQDAVHQHDQTDLEFLLERATRIDFEAFVEDSTLFFRPFSRQPPIALAPRQPDGELRLETFQPRLASTATVQQVVVRGADPATGEEVVGQAAAPTILLEPGEPDPDRVFGRTVVLSVRVVTQDEANAIAKARLAELALSFITGEAVAQGDGRLRAGLVVTIAGLDDRFNGDYLVQGVSHRFSHGEGCRGGYAAVLRLQREDHGLFRISAIDDEVLVAFEHGDLARPVVVGSLWDTDDRCTKLRPHRDQMAFSPPRVSIQ